LRSCIQSKKQDFYGELQKKKGSLSLKKALLLNEGMAKITNTNVKTGIVKDMRNTYGFITPDEGEKDIFVHESNSKDRLSKGDKVEFEIEQAPKGPRAINVKKIKNENVKKASKEE